MSRFSLVALFISMGCLLSPCCDAAEDFVLTISRKHSDGKCTSGYLLVNGKVVCYALERAQLGNIPEISAIPAGSYPGHLRYDHSDKWRIELEKVPGRTHVQIHIGNVPSDSKGCILVGESMDAADLCKVAASAKAYAKLKKEFYGTETPNATPDKRIVVKVEDAR